MSAGDSKKSENSAKRKELYEQKSGLEWHCENTDDYSSWGEFIAKSAVKYGEECKVFAWRWVLNADAEVGEDPDDPPKWSGKDVLILAMNSVRGLSNLVDAEIGVEKGDEPKIHEWLKAHLIHPALAP